MKAVVQRVSQASVEVEGQTVGRIEAGLMVLLGVKKGDTEADGNALASKIAQLRIFEDAQGKMNLSLLDTSRALLAVSQFTLLADTRKGRRPSFVDAMEPGEAKRLYDCFCLNCRQQGLRVEEGVFGAKMKVALVNDGPVTILLESNQDNCALPPA